MIVFNINFKLTEHILFTFKSTEILVYQESNI